MFSLDIFCLSQFHIYFIIFQGHLLCYFFILFRSLIYFTVNFHFIFFLTVLFNNLTAFL